VVFRAIRDDEFPAAAELFFDALTDLTARHNIAAPHRTAETMAEGYRYVARTGIFRVASLGDTLVALACATVRDDIWFLSGFWADPAHRLQGIGGPLLREVWDEGRRRGTRAHYVWASIDFAALASYMKLGMLPGSQLFAFSGVPHALPEVGASLRAEPLDPAAVAGLDRDLVGAGREDDHRFWLGRGRRGVTLWRGRELAGYYVTHKGTIGPAGWATDELGPQVLAHALRDAAADGAEVQLTAPGVNHTALRLAFSSGLQLVRTSHLLWTEPIGHQERYLPSGPLLY
jgi:GNAT superfamily N-acetyltransferase